MVRGRRPTQAFANFCDVNPAPGCLTRGLQELAPPPPYDKVQNSWQTSIGFQRQLGAVTGRSRWTTSTTAAATRRSIQENVNLSFNPATGEPLPVLDVAATRPYPLMGSSR